MLRKAQSEAATEGQRSAELENQLFLVTQWIDESLESEVRSGEVRRRRACDARPRERQRDRSTDTQREREINRHRERQRDK